MQVRLLCYAPDDMSKPARRSKTHTPHREMVLPDPAYQPSKAEMRETVSFDGTLEQFAQELLRPVRVRRSKGGRRSG